ncbi:MAG: bifunctional phosphoglucose/phosphomannose isomerase [Ignavibacteriae bacterium]|nr:bifunctional phosphoglucose/phosphomannose isomerase [Ignavibacteriota bacterium]
MTHNDIKRLDPTGMYNWIRDFPDQIEDAVRIGKSAKFKLNVKGVRNIVVTGLGGSAIGGDLLRSYASQEFKVPLVVNRHYFLPRFVDKDTLVVASSYSGNTEETVAAHLDAAKRKARVLCITTNGETATIAKRYKHPVIEIKKDYQPRAALGYSFFPMLVAFTRLGLLKNKSKEINETVKLLRTKASVYSDPGSPENMPLLLAEQLHSKFPVIYAPNDLLDTVAVRWRGQIAENAKQLGFGNVLPEMNHNELVGWKQNPELLKRLHVVFLRDKNTHKRVAVRENITKGIVSQYASGVSEVWSEGASPLARMFSLIYFGDWTSYYLALLNNEDPTPVKAIDYLKQELGKV